MQRFSLGVLTLVLAGWAWLATAGAMRACGAEASFEAGYSVGYRYLILTDRYLTPDARLKPVSDLTPQQVGAVYHEMWHAWFDLVAPGEAPEFVRRFKTDAEIAHVDVPSEYRLEVHEEAAADFIETVVSTYLQMSRFLAGKTPERRAEIRKEGRYGKVYTRLFNDRYTGYYTETIVAVTTATAPARDLPTSASLRVAAAATSATVRSADSATTGGLVHSIHENPAEYLAGFIASARSAGLPVRYLETVAARIQAVAILRAGAQGTGLEADVQWSVWPLRGADLIFIERDLLEDRFTMDPDKVFAESLFTSATAAGASGPDERTKR